MSDSLFYKPKPNSSEKEIKKKRWNIGAMALKVIKRTCMALGVMVLISAILGAFTTAKLMKNAAPPLPQDMVLVLTLENGLSEQATKPSLFDPFPYDNPTIRSVIDTLDKAAKDSRVHSFVLNYRGGGISLAHINELRPALERFKATGKKAIIYGATYANGTGTGLGTYYLASAFNEIWMQPVGMLSVAGINMEMPFARKALDQLGIQPAFFQREEYKSAMENFSSDQMSDSNREMLLKIVRDFAGVIATDVVKEREMTGADWQRLLDQGLFTDDEALEAGLIDRLDYSDILIDELREAIKAQSGIENTEFISFGYYSSRTKPIVPNNTQNKVALINVNGTITDIADRQGGFDAYEIAQAIHEAGRDKGLETIVIRVNSPGGSPSASETIRRAIVKAQKRGKRVIVSMGEVAASGGYWLSADADEIYALPTTLTGSIGVVMGKFVLGDLWDKLNINWDSVSYGQNANLFSFNEDFTPAQKQRMNAMIDQTYQAFLKRVADGRDMQLSEVRKVAKGRAWTGLAASQIGLVDKLGGLDTALNDIAQAKGLNDKSQLNVVILPKPQTPIEQLIEAFSNQVAVGEFLNDNAAVLERVNAILMSFGQLQNATTNSVYDADLDAFVSSLR
ncbi:MAG: signal peptide peptidase SppA [Pseudomonadota bacterium]